MGAACGGKGVKERARVSGKRPTFPQKGAVAPKARTKNGGRSPGSRALAPPATEGGGGGRGL